MSVRSDPGLPKSVQSNQGLATSVWSVPYLIFGLLGLNPMSATQALWPIPVLGRGPILG